MLSHTAPKKLFLSVVVIGVIFGCLNAFAQDDPIGDIFAREKDIPEDYGDELLVEVEPNYLVPSGVTGGFYLVPYKLRRPKWGGTFSISYSTFEPTNYEPDFVFVDYEDNYSSPSAPLIELIFGLKRNFSLGSITTELAGGMFSAESNGDFIDSELNITMIRLGLNLSFDTLFLEPYIVPYGLGGLYTTFYDETQAAVKVGGSTEWAPYVGAGVAFQIDWLDKQASRDAYIDTGMENTFIFVEARRLLASQNSQDPDLETDFHFDAGLKLEF